MFTTILWKTIQPPTNSNSPTKIKKNKKKLAFLKSGINFAILKRITNETNKKKSIPAFPYA